MNIAAQRKERDIAITYPGGLGPRGELVQGERRRREIAFTHPHTGAPGG